MSPAVLTTLVLLCSSGAWGCYSTTPANGCPRQDCTWSSWGAYSTCVDLQQYRIRTKLTAETCGGTCSGTYLELRTCQAEPNAGGQCGNTRVALREMPAIFNGLDVYPPGKYPWVISIQGVQDSIHYCGGALIADRWVLTAGHCATILSTYTHKVIAAEHNLDYLEGYEGTRFISRIITHPLFTYVSNPFKIEYDLALLELSVPFFFSNRVQPICLPTTTYYRSCVVTGWGKQSSGGAAGGVLQEIPATAITKQACWQRRPTYTWLKTSPTVCTTSPDSAKICQGDSGSPLVCQEDNHYVVVGLASWSRSGCEDYGEEIGAFASTIELASWIRQTCGNCV